MASSHSHPRIPNAVLVAISIATSLWRATEAVASQGPGGGPGTASHFTQLAMAIIVYGSAALLVGAGLIGAARRRRIQPRRQ
jgi:hypothetical protein